MAEENVIDGVEIMAGEHVIIDGVEIIMSIFGTGTEDMNEEEIESLKEYFIKKEWQRRVELRRETEVIHKENYSN